MTDSDLVQRLEKRANELHPVFDVHERQLLREAATALRTPPSDRGEVHIKPLEWQDWKGGGFIARANDLLEYSISRGQKHFRLYFGEHRYLGAFDGEDEAKAAAEADYRQRILSCLEPSPPARDAEGE